LLAKNVNDNAGILNTRGVLELFASKLAPTGFRVQGDGRWSLLSWFVAVFFYSQLKGYPQESLDRNSLALRG